MTESVFPEQALSPQSVTLEQILGAAVIAASEDGHTDPRKILEYKNETRAKYRNAVDQTSVPGSEPIDFVVGRFHYYAEGGVVYLLSDDAGNG